LRPSSLSPRSAGFQSAVSPTSSRLKGPKLQSTQVPLAAGFGNPGRPDRSEKSALRELGNTPLPRPLRATLALLFGLCWLRLPFTQAALASEDGLFKQVLDLSVYAAQFVLGPGL